MNTSVPMSSVMEIALIVGGAVFLMSLASGTIFTAITHRLSWRFGALDNPDGHLKCHRHPTATLGGIPLIIAIVLGIGFLYFVAREFDQSIYDLFALNISRGALLVSAFIIVSLGIMDDLHHVMPRTKLLFQMLASTVLIGSGLVIYRCDFFGVFDFSLGAFAVPFTLFWLVGSCNALNFIDGLDGLASGLGVIISLALAGLGFYNGAYGPAILALAVSGGLLAILLFNIRPALIFLGDSGSQLVGLILGALTIKIAVSNGGFALPCAGLMLSVPIIDAFLSILRRFSSSESPASGDRNHIHHCLRHLGLTVNQTSMTLWVITATACLMGFACFTQTGVSIGLIALSFVIVELYFGIRLGCLNTSEFLQRLSTCFRWNSFSQKNSLKRMAELEALWDKMKPFFEQMNLDRAILTLEGVGEDGRTNYETYQWVRNDKLIAELLNSRWTKRFSLGTDASQKATLRLESTAQLTQDEQRINWLLKQISSNMQHVASSQKKPEHESMSGKEATVEIGVKS